MCHDRGATNSCPSVVCFLYLESVAIYYMLMSVLTIEKEGHTSCIVLTWIDSCIEYVILKAYLLLLKSYICTKGKTGTTKDLVRIYGYCSWRTEDDCEEKEDLVSG